MPCARCGSSGTPEGDITAVTYDARSAVPGALHVCVPGLRADGHDFAPTAVEHGAVALIVERVLDLPVTQLVVESSRQAMAAGGRRLLRPSQRRAPGGRRHRHQRQDDHRLPDALDPVRRRAAARAAGHGRVARRRRRRAGHPDDAGERRPAGDPASHGRRRRPQLRDGGLVARARAAAGRQPALRRRRVHQPDAGPSRLPPGHGGVLPGQAAAVRGPGCARAPSTWATRTAGGSRQRRPGRC